MPAINHIQLLRTIYNQYAASIENWDYTNSPEHYLSEVEQSPPDDFSLDTLDNYSTKDYGRSLDLRLVVAHLPHPTVINELGENLLTWTCLGYPYNNETFQQLNNSLAKYLDINVHNLRLARLTSWQLHHSSSAAASIANYKIINGLKKFITDLVDLPALLKLCALNEQELSSKRANDYSLEVIELDDPDKKHYFPYGWANGYRYKLEKDRLDCIYLDGPIGILLLYKGKPNAILSFTAKDKKTLMINQLQPVFAYKVEEGKDPTPDNRIAPRGLMAIDWEKLMVSIGEIVADYFNFSSVAIQSGVNNKWVKEKNSDGTPHMTLKEAITRYDKVADRLCYVKRKDKNWYKDIDSKEIIVASNQTQNQQLELVA